MDAGITRISVETESDWLRVKANVERSLDQSLEARLAALPGGKTGEASRAVRKEAERRLARIKEELWRMTKSNISVNGHNYEDFVEATEPFDEALDRSIYGLNTERIVFNINVSEQRKRRPFLLRAIEQRLERDRTAAEWLPEDDAELLAENRKPIGDLPLPPRHKEVMETFQQVVSNLSELSSSAPQQLARAQRAQSVKTEVAAIPR
ncbi:hypothetical protein BD324DRAFT_606441 [Kockovaella imperatae]|uniref:Uncharacterized protein n=1 Tax=Kockovaella imperatae TaxID=4999 RepID=A0A1Y1USY5_9TREE|nr:hypothetical protein BD324DRAFT_606441 [Kockovaella imperatae]ORX40546.1 hypothetical protein BD324DRAFT_606441 [Kockovaella imperatae]